MRSGIPTRSELAALSPRQISSLLQHSRLAEPQELRCHVSLCCPSPLRQGTGSLRLYAEATGRNVEFIPECFTEMGRIVESPRVCDIGNRILRTSGVAKIFPAAGKSHSQNRF